MNASHIFRLLLLPKAPTPHRPNRASGPLRATLSEGHWGQRHSFCSPVQQVKGFLGGWHSPPSLCYVPEAVTRVSVSYLCRNWYIFKTRDPSRKLCGAASSGIPEVSKCCQPLLSEQPRQLQLQHTCLKHCEKPHESSSGPTGDLSGRV